jgi:hypothetical protein
MLELLRKKQGESQVTQQQNGQNQRNYGDHINLHGRLPQLLASLDVEKRQDKEDYREQQHHHILHNVSSVRSGKTPDKLKNYSGLHPV